MKKLLALLLAAMMVLSLAACGGNTNDPSEPPAPSESTPVETKAPESTTPESTAPATNDSEWAQEATVNYFFEETGEEVPMTIKTNADHSKYNFTFMFFGEQQDMTCTADGEVLDDLTGFIGKDAQKFLTFIQEKVTDSDWKAIGDGSGAADGSEWAQEATVNYFFEETGEEVPLTIKTNADHSKYNFTFMFFGEQQDMTCTADGEVLDDLTGFIGKDAKKFLTFIQEKVTDSDWKAIGDGSGAADGSEWAQEATVNYFFEETGEDVPMTIKTNADHSKYNFTFMFFGEQQDMTCTADGEVLDDLTGFIGKDAKKFLTFIQEKVTDSDWKAIG